MDDGRPTPAPPSNVVEAKPTVARIVVIVGGVLAVAAAAVGILLWNTGGSGLSYVAPRLLGVMLFVPLAALLVTSATSRSVTLTERLTGWKNPTVEFTPWPPRLGRTMTALYRRQAISPRTRRRLQTPLRVETALICEEWVEYTVGTDTRTETHDVVKRHAAAVAVPSVDGTGLEAVLTLTIPSDAGGPTIELDHNRIRWRLDTRLGHPFGKRTAARIDLRVEPVLDLDSLIGEGGRGGEPSPEAES
ncbi:MAG: hypothetical protein OES24_08305 [Acidimicrobiia bacterium]|nr:hypothetical protein [Acidimicrobiia bacterium]